jgi:hypothetical protein
MAFDLCTIGQLLREERENQGLTCEGVSNALFIREQAIEAIESGDWQGLPHRVYVRGYVRQYAGLLKIAGVIEGELVSWGDESPVYDLPSAHLPAAADGGAGTMQKGKVPFWRSIAAGTSKFYALCRHCFF